MATLKEISRLALYGLACAGLLYILANVNNGWFENQPPNDARIDQVQGLDL